MNFLGIGPGELMLIMVMALIIFGPGKMPEIGAGLGKAIREFRRTTSEITEQFTREMSLETPPQQPSPTATTSATAVAEEPHPMAAPIDQELHPPSPVPVEGEPAVAAAQGESPASSVAEATPHAATAEATSQAATTAAPRRRVRRIGALPVADAVGDGEATVAAPSPTESVHGVEDAAPAAPGEDGDRTKSAVLKARRLRAAKAAAMKEAAAMIEAAAMKEKDTVEAPAAE